LANFAQALILEVTKQDGDAVGVLKCSHRVVEVRFNVRPVGCRSVHSVQFVSDLFAELAAGFSPDDINGSPARDLIQPGAENGVGREAVRLAREIGESGLSDLFGELRRTDLAERGRKNEV
jgi:hypothetical protein